MPYKLARSNSLSMWRCTNKTAHDGILIVHQATDNVYRDIPAFKPAAFHGAPPVPRHRTHLTLIWFRPKKSNEHT